MYKQILLKKQTQQQALDQATSHNTLLKTLSTAEIYALGYSPDRFFAEFGNKNLVKKREALKLQLEKQIACIQDSYLIFISMYGEYEFPKKYPKEQILDYLKELREEVKTKEDKSLYTKLIDIFTGRLKDIEDIPINDGPENDIAMNDVHVGNMMQFSSNYSHEAHEREQKVKEEYQKKGKYTGEIYSDKEFNGHMNRFQRDMSQPIPGYSYEKPVSDEIDMK